MIGLVLAAAGTGSRFGSDLPKQFSLAEGKPLYIRALEQFAGLFEQAVLVVPESWREQIEWQIQSLPYQDRLILETGGPQRQDSINNGLRRLSNQIELVLVHDAVRPFASRQLITRVIDGARRHGACIPVIPVADSVKEVSNGRVVRTLDRKDLFLVQTPQGFKISLLKRAYAKALKEGFHGTDESALVERLSLPVHTVEGERTNIKVTWKEDLPH